MSIDLASIMAKATKFAERATTEDKAGNYDVAADAYMAAAEWLVHATKYGAMNDPTKKTVRAKADTYLKRAEELKKTLNKTTASANPTASSQANISANPTASSQANISANPTASSKPNVPAEATEDPDTIRMMQKFQGAIVTNPSITFDDVVGLEQAKTALKETVILPVKFPKLFRDKRKPWSGILLYGPPGTGKSYLAKATASESNCTFISITSADIMSKWLGEGEKGVKCLFQLARERRPCIIFIDEIDALCGQRSDSGNEASQRVLIEFLTQMDGVGNDNAGVLVLAATNRPWALDTAMRRRLQKRIYIPLPQLNERLSMFKTHLGTTIPNTIKDHDWMQLGQKSDHYSGADISVVCREALLLPIRRLTTATHFKRVPNQNRQPDEPTHGWLACSPGDPDAQVMSIDKINPDELCEPPVTIFDMLSALAVQKATVGEADLAKYRAFTDEYGQEGV